jgi:formiminoglutamase
MENGWGWRYEPAKQKVWQGRHDEGAEGRLYQCVQMADLREEKLGAGIALLGFACDEGVKRNIGHEGAAEGPEAARAALANLPTQNGLRLVDVGDVTCTDGNMEESQDALAAAVATIHGQGGWSLVVGGGHELVVGHHVGLCQSHPDWVWGLINIDTLLGCKPLVEGGRNHRDTGLRQLAEWRERADRPLRAACLGFEPLANAQASLEMAEASGWELVAAGQIWEEGVKCCQKAIQEIARQCHAVQLSVSLEAVSGGEAPGVGNVHGNGLASGQLLALIELVFQCGRPIACDLSDLAPKRDRTGRTAALAGLILSQMAHRCAQQVLMGVAHARLR